MSGVEDLVVAEKVRTETINDEHIITEKIDRLYNQERALKDLDEEQQRRVNELKAAEISAAMERLKNAKLSSKAAEDEQKRRVGEDLSKNLKEQLLRRHNSIEATRLAEEERTRRLEEFGTSQQIDKSERKRNQEAANDAMEQERLRRINSEEHAVKMASLSPRKAESSISRAAGELSMHDKRFTPDSDVIVSEGKVHLTDVENVTCLDNEEKNTTEATTEYQLPVASRNASAETKALLDMRKKLTTELASLPQYDELIGDIRLLRFLRETHLKVDQAVANYRKMVEWRQEVGMNAIREDIVSNNLAIESFPGYEKILSAVPMANFYESYDRHGNVLAFEATGAIDVHKLLATMTEEEFVKFYYYELEYRSIILDRKSRESGVIVRSSIIRDLQGLSMSHAKLLSWFRRVMKASVNHYPDTVATLYLINSPWIFNSLFSMIKIWFTEEQLKLVRVLDNDYMTALASSVNKDQLPICYGGTNENMKIPESGLRGGDAFDKFIYSSGGIEMEVKHRSMHQIPFNMERGDVLSWQFYVKSNDISFLVKFRTQGDGGATEEIVVKADRFKEGLLISSSWTSPAQGTALLVWDNAFSWTRGKRIAYKASVSLASSPAAQK